LDSVGADADPGEEIDRIMQRPAELECKRAKLRPRPRGECERERDISKCRGPNQSQEIAAGLGAGRGREPSKQLAATGCQPKQRGRRNVEDQELPEEPLRSARPNR